MTAIRRESTHGDSAVAGAVLSDSSEYSRAKLNVIEKSNLDKLEAQLLGTGLTVDIQLITTVEAQTLVSENFNCSRLRLDIQEYIRSVLELFPAQSIDSAVKMLLQILWRSKSPTEFICLSREGALQLLQVLTNTSNMLGSQVALHGNLDFSLLPENDNDVRSIISKLFGILRLTDYYSIRLPLDNVASFKKFALSCVADPVVSAET